MEQIELVGHAAELGQRGRLHLPHHVASMNLDGDFADAEIEGNLLAEPTPYDVNHDLTFTGGQRFEALSERTQGLVVLTPGTIAREAELDCIEKLLITKRLLKELDGTAFHRLYRHLDVAMRS